MPVDNKLENWNKENYPISSMPTSPERPTPPVKYSHPRLVLKSVEKSSYVYQSEDSSSSQDEEENMQKPGKSSSSPLKQFAHPPRKVAKLLFGVRN